MIIRGLLMMSPTKIFFKKSVLFNALTLSFISLAHADTAKEIADIKNNLEKRNPPIQTKSIQPSPIAGLYEVFSNGNIFYVDKDVRHVIVGGAVIEDSTKKNLTGERLKELTSIKFDSLPFKDAIEVKKGNGSYKFAVFSDPDCPFCKRLEQGLDKTGMTDYTAYIFLLPIKELHPDAVAKSESIWCAKDKKEAWTSWMVKDTTPEKVTCNNPIASNEKLAEQLGVSGTPTIYLEDGSQTQDPKVLISAISAKK